MANEVTFKFLFSVALTRGLQDCTKNVLSYFEHQPRSLLDALALGLAFELALALAVAAAAAAAPFDFVYKL